MKVLITGSSGQIGTYLVTQFASTSHEVIGLNHQHLDITDKHKTQIALTNHKPDVVINLAAYTAVDAAETNIDQAYAVNHQGAENISRAAANINAAIIHVSTDYVFSGEKARPYTEDDAPNPLNVYGKSKLAGEIAVKKANARHLILRTSWVFSNTRSNFLSTMLELRKTKKTISVVNDQTGGPTYAKDIANVIISICDQLAEFKGVDWGTYHYSGTPYVTWLEFAQHIFNLANNHHETNSELVAIPSSQYPCAAHRPLNSRLDHQKIIARLSIQPSDWQHALTELLDIRH